MARLPDVVTVLAVVVIDVPDVSVREAMAAAAALVVDPVVEGGLVTVDVAFVDGRPRFTNPTMDFRVEARRLVLTLATDAPSTVKTASGIMGAMYCARMPTCVRSVAFD